jgi:type IV pilus assembly protein PilW
MNNHIRGCFLNTNRGFTLVELMVSLAVGMVIVLFVSSLYIRSRGSQRITDDNGRMQEEAQAVMNLLGRNVMQAGYGNLTGHKAVDLEGKGFMGCDTGFADPKVADADGKTDPSCATAGTPGFQVRYRAEGSYQSATGLGADCNGQAAPNGIVINRFYLATKTGETTQSLYCSGNGSFASPQPLLGNVEDMRLTYGVDTNLDQSADRFLTKAADVKGIDPSWKSVVSVSVCLLVASDNNVAPAPQTYKDCTGADKTATDRKIRTAITRLFTLRNNAATRNQ